MLREFQSSQARLAKEIPSDLSLSSDGDDDDADGAIAPEEAPRRPDSAGHGRSPARPRRSQRARLKGLFKQAREFYEQDRPAECLELATKILDADPQHATALVLKEWATMRGREDEAARQARAAVAAGSRGWNDRPQPTARTESPVARKARWGGGQRQVPRQASGVHAPRQALELAQQRPARIYRAPGVWADRRGPETEEAALEWGVAAVVHTARDAAATLIQSSYRGGSVRRRWFLPQAVTLVDQINATQHLRGTSFRRISASQLASKKAELCQLLSTPIGRRKRGSARGLAQLPAQPPPPAVPPYYPPPPAGFAPDLGPLPMAGPMLQSVGLQPPEGWLGPPPAGFAPEPPAAGPAPPGMGMGGYAQQQW